MMHLAMALFNDSEAVGGIPGNGAFWVFLSVSAVVMFGVFIPLVTWIDSRRKEREAYYRAETLRRVSEASSEGREGDTRAAVGRKPAKTTANPRGDEDRRIDYCGSGNRPDDFSAVFGRTGLSVPGRIDSLPCRCGDAGLRVRNGGADDRQA